MAPILSYQKAEEGSTHSKRNGTSGSRIIQIQHLTIDEGGKYHPLKLYSSKAG